MGYHFGTWGARGTRLQYSFHAHCTEGMLEVDRSDGQLILHRDAEEGAKGRGADPREPCPSKAREPARSSTSSTASRPARARSPTARSSLQGLRVIWRLYEAEQKGVVADLRGLGFKNAVAR